MPRLSIKYKLYFCGKKLRSLDQQRATSAQVYNHCIALHKRYYNLYKKFLSCHRLKVHLTKLKKLLKYAHWRCLGSQAIQDIAERIDKGYKLFFQERKKGNKKIKPPSFKKRVKYKSFTLKQHGAGYQFLNGNQLRIGKKTYKYVKHREIPGKIKTLTIKKDSLGDWWICVSCEMERFNAKGISSSGNTSGYDFGLKMFLTSSHEEFYESPQFFKASIKQIKKFNKALARKKDGSKGRAKAKQSLAFAHRKIANKRRDFHFKLARELLLQNDFLVFETLSLEAMKLKWGRKVADLGFAEFVKIIEHMGRKLGKEVVFVGRWEPTTKTCSSCLHVLEGLPLQIREWICPKCGVQHQRDANAARNILRIGASMRALQDAALSDVSPDAASR